LGIKSSFFGILKEARRSEKRSWKKSRLIHYDSAFLKGKGFWSVLNFLKTLKRQASEREKIILFSLP
jgi:hypothetical protein